MQQLRRGPKADNRRVLLWQKVNALPLMARHIGETPLRCLPCPVQHIVTKLPAIIDGLSERRAQPSPSKRL